MKIIVEGYEIETREITHITEAGRRRCGFIIHLTGNKSITIDQKEPYDAYPSEVAQINDKYRELRKKVVKEWEKDKADHIVLCL